MLRAESELSFERGKGEGRRDVEEVGVRRVWMEASTGLAPWSDRWRARAAHLSSQLQSDPVKASRIFSTTRLPARFSFRRYPNDKSHGRARTRCLL